MLDMRDVGVPQEVADKLTIVESVNRLNYTKLREMVANQDKRIKYIVQKDGTRLDMATVRGRTDLQVGCSVERTLRDGDLVLFNRQPSLHRMSIMCHRAKILKGKTFRLNLSCTTPYNADFVSFFVHFSSHFLSASDLTLSLLFLSLGWRRNEFTCFTDT